MSQTEVDLPAWSLRRDDPRTRALPRSWPHRIDREWAWSGSEGAGVRVAIVDSGIDGDHELVGGLQRAVAVQKTAEGGWEVNGRPLIDTGGTGFVPINRVQGATRGGQLKVTTTNMKPGYIRKNGVPYSDKAVLTEYFTVLSGPTERYVHHAHGDG